MEEQFQREKILIGNENISKLHKAKVAIYGIGGVGSFVCEALARVGIGNIILIDKDVISISNINRQIHATYKTIGKYKVEVMKERIKDIYPNCCVQTYLPQEVEAEEDIIDISFDYVIDAVDTIDTKLKLIEKCDKIGVPIISSMGTGNKLDGGQFKITDIYKTSVCPLAKIMRKKLKQMKIKKLKVLYSEEESKNTEGGNIIGSISFVPSVAGLLIAGEVVRDILKK